MRASDLYRCRWFLADQVERGTRIMQKSGKETVRRLIVILAGSVFVNRAGPNDSIEEPVSLHKQSVRQEDQMSEKHPLALFTKYTVCRIWQSANH